MKASLLLIHVFFAVTSGHKTDESTLVSSAVAWAAKRISECGDADGCPDVCADGCPDVGCFTSNPGAPQSDLAESLYTGVERFPGTVCTPQKGDTLMAFPFNVGFPIQNSVGFNTVSDSAISMAAVNAVPGLENVKRYSINGTHLAGFQTQVAAIPGYNITWLRGDGNFPSDALVPPTTNTPFINVTDFLSNSVQPMRSDLHFLTLYFVIETSGTRCMARFEGTGGMPAAAYAGGAVMGDIAGTIITDCTDANVKLYFDKKHMVASFDFASHWVNGFATLTFRPWTNPQACLPMKMGLTGWMMV